MKKNSVILKVLHDFLSLFNLGISKADKEYLNYTLCLRCQSTNKPNVNITSWMMIINTIKIKMIILI